MLNAALDNCISRIRQVWSAQPPENISVVEQCIAELGQERGFISQVLSELGESQAKEIHRDANHGFVLTVYREVAGQYRIPHDHGEGWVVYTVLNGMMDMGGYTLDAAYQAGRPVRDSLVRLSSGESRTYLPGDIHDTLCITDRVVILRFTSCDLKVEEREGRMKRYEIGKELFPCSLEAAGQVE